MIAFLNYKLHELLQVTDYEETEDYILVHLGSPQYISMIIVQKLHELGLMMIQNVGGQVLLRKDENVKRGQL